MVALQWAKKRCGSNNSFSNEPYCTFCRKRKILMVSWVVILVSLNNIART